MLWSEIGDYETSRKPLTQTDRQTSVSISDAEVSNNHLSTTCLSEVSEKICLSEDLGIVSVWRLAVLLSGMNSFVQPVKQHPGQQQVDRRVKVNVPGRHFPQLTSAEQKNEYEGEAVEYRERQRFERHSKAWGAAHTGPGLRFVCRSDAIEDPDTKGFWTTLFLWNRWRHDTFKDDRDAELLYLDELPQAPEETEKESASALVPAVPPVKLYFTLTGRGVHTFGGKGKMAGKTAPYTSWACIKPGCWRGPQKPIKQVGPLAPLPP